MAEQLQKKTRLGSKRLCENMSRLRGTGEGSALRLLSLRITSQSPASPCRSRRCSFFVVVVVFPQDHLRPCAFPAEWARQETSASLVPLAPRLTKTEMPLGFFPRCAAGGATTRFSHQACPMKSEPGLGFTRTAVHVHAFK